MTETVEPIAPAEALSRTLREQRTLSAIEKKCQGLRVICPVMTCRVENKSVKFDEYNATCCHSHWGCRKSKNLASHRARLAGTLATLMSSVACF